MCLLNVWREMCGIFFLLISLFALLSTETDSKVIELLKASFGITIYFFVFMFFNS